MSKLNCRGSMDRYPCCPLLLNSFTPTSPSHHQSLALPSDVQDDEGWMWLSAEPAVVAPKLARNSGQNFQKQGMPLPPAEQKQSMRFLAVKFLLTPAMRGHNVSLSLNYPRKALPVSADTSASLQGGMVCQEMPFENMSHTY